MKIAVNTRLLLKNKLEGIGWFAYEVLQRVVKNYPEHEFIFIFDRPYAEEFVFAKNVTPIVVGPPARHAFLFYQWFERSVPKIVKKHQADLFFSPDGYLSLSLDIPQIQVIHDLAFEHYPKQVPFWARKHYQYYFPKYAKKAEKILTVSAFSKQDIVHRYGISQDKIQVVYNGVSSFYAPLKAGDKKEIRDQYSEGKPYFVYVGSINPRKNIDRLLQAFDRFAERDKDDVCLLLVGEKMWKDNMLEQTFQTLKHKDRIKFTGRLAQFDLARVMGSALGLTYVSLFEGFGIPIAEAMQCGVPVITSNVSSMPEVAGEAAVLVDPNSIEDISNGMITIATNNRLRGDLITKGFEQVQKFSWDKTAQKVASALFGK